MSTDPETNLQVRPSLAAPLCSKLNQFAHSSLVENLISLTTFKSQGGYA
jgi:hypothetical protein